MKSIFIFIFLLTSLSLFSQIPTGYYTTAQNKTGTALQQALHDIIDNHTSISYSALWNAYQTTDVKSNGKVWDMYSDNPSGTISYEFTVGTNQCGNYNSEGDCYNREHSFPQSWFNEQSPMVSDLFQVYPTDGYVNNKRGNFPFGETTSPTWVSSNGSKLGNCSNTGYSGIVFEPIDAYKGDFARTMLYMATRYYGEDGNWPGSAMVNGSQPKEWALAVLLKWHNNDPVSTKEINRNNAVYTIQKNRNPFIDHPEYANYIWGGQTPDNGGGGDDDDNNNNNENETTDHTPSNHVTDFSSSFVKLNWIDSKGNSAPNGYLILVSPTGFNAIQAPTDGTLPENYPNSKVVKQGVQTCVFDNLEKNRTYYFKIYPFTGSGLTTDYKTDGTIPQDAITVN